MVARPRERGRARPGRAAQGRREPARRCRRRLPAACGGHASTRRGVVARRRQRRRPESDGQRGRREPARHAGLRGRPLTSRGGLARHAVPARPDLGRRGDELLALLRERRARRALPLRRRRQRDARRADRAHGVQLALLPPRRRAGTALRLPRARRVRPRVRPPLQPAQAPDRPVREGDRGAGALGAGERPAVRPRPGPGRRPRARRRGRRGRDPEVRRRRPERFDWEDDRPPATPWHDTVIYEVHVEGLHEAAPGRARRPARHVRGARLRAGARVLPRARRHRGRAAADPPHRRRELPARQAA